MKYNVLILGHRGMLGHMVHKYLSTKDNCKLVTTDLRWPTKDFKNFITGFWYDNAGDYIINCIGAIHQNKNKFEVNTDLPIWLDKDIDYNLNRCRVIHPGTDTSEGDYGISKYKSEKYILERGCITHIIKTSIIGPEISSKNSLLEWFLNKELEVFGYSESYWNGITTLQWAKICYDIICNKYDINKTMTAAMTECISKYELLSIMKEVFNKNIDILKNSGVKVNRCLDGDINTKNIKQQLIELKKFYYDN